jgi:phage baseplate assembly protein W
LPLTHPKDQKVYDFLSIGISSVEQTAAAGNQSQIKLPLSIKTPLEFGTDTDGLFKMHYELENAIADNFRNMVLTNHGERLGLYNFGGNLKPLLFELGNEDVDMLAMQNISVSTATYMPFISLRSFIPTPIAERDENSMARIMISIIYDIPVLKITNKRLDVTLYEGG